MSYGEPQLLTLSWGAIDFGTGSPIAASFTLPKGKVGEIRDVIVSATEIFTTGGDVLIGIAAAGADYVNFPLGTLAATDTLRASDTAGAIVLQHLPADTQIEVTWNDTGGTPTGIGHVWFVIDVYDANATTTPD